jgi:predicted DsbA family dithiol-disulfide isomerase
MEFVFYYDVVCPFAYIASRLVEGLAHRTKATIRWRPVLLGGLYRATKAPQGEHGSSMDVMVPAKRRIVNEGRIIKIKIYCVKIISIEAIHLVMYPSDYLISKVLNNRLSNNLIPSTSEGLTSQCL